MILAANTYEVLGRHGCLGNFVLVVPRGHSSERTLFCSPIFASGTSPVFEGASGTCTQSPHIEDSHLAGDYLLDLTQLQPQTALAMIGMGRMGRPPVLAALNVRLVPSPAAGVDARFLLAPMTPEILSDLATRASSGACEHQTQVHTASLIAALKPLCIGPAMIDDGRLALSRLFQHLFQSIPDPVPGLGSEIDFSAPTQDLTDDQLAAIGTCFSGYGLRPLDPNDPTGPKSLRWVVPLPGLDAGEFPKNMADPWRGLDFKYISEHAPVKERFDVAIAALEADIQCLTPAHLFIIGFNADAELRDIARGITRSKYPTKNLWIWRSIQASPSLDKRTLPPHLDLDFRNILSANVASQHEDFWADT